MGDFLFTTADQEIIDYNEDDDEDSKKEEVVIEEAGAAGRVNVGVRAVVDITWSCG